MGVVYTPTSPLQLCLEYIGKQDPERASSPFTVFQTVSGCAGSTLVRTSGIMPINLVRYKKDGSKKHPGANRPDTLTSMNKLAQSQTAQRDCINGN
jgi:hypothetical protein